MLNTPSKFHTSCCKRLQGRSNVRSFGDGLVSSAQFGNCFVTHRCHPHPPLLQQRHSRKQPGTACLSCALPLSNVVYCGHPRVMWPFPWMMQWPSTAHPLWVDGTWKLHKTNLGSGRVQPLPRAALSSVAAGGVVGRGWVVAGITAPQASSWGICILCPLQVCHWLSVTHSDPSQLENHSCSKFPISTALTPKLS